MLTSQALSSVPPPAQDHFWPTGRGQTQKSNATVREVGGEVGEEQTRTPSWAGGTVGVCILRAHLVLHPHHLSHLPQTHTSDPGGVGRTPGDP